MDLPCKAGLFVGVSEFDHYKNLPSARQDALNLLSYFVDASPDGDWRTNLRSEGDLDGRADLMVLIREWIQSKDTVPERSGGLLSFSSHGFVDESRLVLATSDTRPQNEFDTGIALRRIFEMCAKRLGDGSSFLIIFDCCNQGQHIFVCPDDVPPNVNLFIASAGTSIALSSSDGGQFTKSFIRSLSERRDNSSLGYAGQTLRSLAAQDCFNPMTTNTEGFLGRAVIHSFPSLVVPSRALRDMTTHPGVSEISFLFSDLLEDKARAITSIAFGILPEEQQFEFKPVPGGYGLTMKRSERFEANVVSVWRELDEKEPYLLKSVVLRLVNGTNVESIVRLLKRFFGDTPTSFGPDGGGNVIHGFKEIIGDSTLQVFVEKLSVRMNCISVDSNNQIRMKTVSSAALDVLTLLFAEARNERI